MRSFASAFSLGRGGRTDNASSASVQSAPSDPPRITRARSTALFTKAPKTPVETSVSVLSRPALTPGSSCSSDGSASLQTPEDESVMPVSAKSDERKRWSSWFGWRKPSDRDVLGSPVESEHAPPQSVPISKRQGNDRTAASERVSRQSASASDSDEQQSSSSESTEHPQSSTVIARRSALQRTAVVQARANLRTMLRNYLSRSPLPPPLVETSSALFPRSCATLGSAQQALTLESTMHVRKMLWRLDHRTLSDTEVQSILSLARKPQPKETTRNRIVDRRTDDDIIAYASMRVGHFSRGLRKWASRPAFEQRVLVWMPDDNGDIICKGVMGVGRDLAVYDLEISEGLASLAGLDLDDEAFEQNLTGPPPPPKKVFNPKYFEQSKPASTPQRTSFRRTPSPLRLDHAAPAEPVTTVSPVSAVKPRNYGSSRHDSTGPVETIPMGYAMQAKQRRAEKTRFLQAEREKRTMEMASHEAMERQRRELEQRRAVEEQKRREEERKRIEEEKRVRQERLKEKYNEEVAAARQRIECARLGTDNYVNIREMHQREKARTYTRPAYDPTPPPVSLPRRSASDFSGAGDALARTALNNSRPTSLAESSRDRRISAAAPASNNSRDDIRTTSHRRQSSGPEVSQRQQQPSRPPSIASSPSRPVSVHRVQSAPNQVPLMAYPMMPVMPMIPQMHPIPPLSPIPPMPIWNMPLLPPTAPFMMQPYSRSPSPGSNPNSRDHSPSRRQSSMPPPSPSRRQSSLQSSTPSPSRPNNALPNSASRHSRNNSGENIASRVPSERRGSYGAPQRPSRSTNHSPLQQSVSQPIHRDGRPQNPRHGSSTNIAQKDSKRRTTLM